MKNIDKFRIKYNKDRKDYFISPYPYPQVVADKINKLINRVETLERILKVNKILK